MAVGNETAAELCVLRWTYRDVPLLAKQLRTSGWRHLQAGDHGPLFAATLMSADKVYVLLIRTEGGDVSPVRGGSGIRPTWRDSC